MLNPFKLQNTQNLENEQFKIVLLHTKEIHLTSETIPTTIAMLKSWRTNELEEIQTEETTNKINAINLRIASYEKLLTQLKNGLNITTLLDTI